MFCAVVCRDSLYAVLPNGIIVCFFFKHLFGPFVPASPAASSISRDELISDVLL